jgi:hypothetical protein
MHLLPQLDCKRICLWGHSGGNLPSCARLGLSQGLRKPIFVRHTDMSQPSQEDEMCSTCQLPQGPAVHPVCAAFEQERETTSRAFAAAHAYLTGVLRCSVLLPSLSAQFFPTTVANMRASVEQLAAAMRAKYGNHLFDRYFVFHEPSGTYLLRLLHLDAVGVTWEGKAYWTCATRRDSGDDDY